MPPKLNAGPQGGRARSGRGGRATRLGEQAEFVPQLAQAERSLVQQVRGGEEDDQVVRPPRPVGEARKAGLGQVHHTVAGGALQRVQVAQQRRILRAAPRLPPFLLGWMWEQQRCQVPLAASPRGGPRLCSAACTPWPRSLCKPFRRTGSLGCRPSGRRRTRAVGDHCTLCKVEGGDLPAPALSKHSVVPHWLQASDVSSYQAFASADHLRSPRCYKQAPLARG